MTDYATLVRQQIKRASEEARRRNLLSQKARKNIRLNAALRFGPSRSLERKLLGQLAWYNAITKQHTYFELYQELSDGEGKFSVYVNGEPWRNGWSKTRFVKMLSRKIDSLKVYFE